LIAVGFESERLAVLLGGISAWYQAGYGLDKWNDPS